MKELLDNLEIRLLKIEKLKIDYLNEIEKMEKEKEYIKSLVEYYKDSNTVVLDELINKGKLGVEEVKNSDKSDSRENPEGTIYKTSDKIEKMEKVKYHITDLVKENNGITFNEIVNSVYSNFGVKRAVTNRIMKTIEDKVRFKRDGVKYRYYTV